MKKILFISLILASCNKADVILSKPIVRDTIVPSVSFNSSRYADLYGNITISAYALDDLAMNSLELRYGNGMVYRAVINNNPGKVCKTLQVDVNHNMGDSLVSHVTAIATDLAGNSSTNYLTIYKFY